jgi:hypothetical protein
MLISFNSGRPMGLGGNCQVPSTVLLFRHLARQLDEDGSGTCPWHWSFDGSLTAILGARSVALVKKGGGSQVQGSPIRVRLEQKENKARGRFGCELGQIHNARKCCSRV